MFVTNPVSVAKVAQSNAGGLASALTPTYEPLITIGGSLTVQMDSWIKNFPTDYLTSKDAFYNGAQEKLSLGKEQLTSATFSSVGFSSSTSTTSSSGWFFWNYGKLLILLPRYKS